MQSQDIVRIPLGVYGPNAKRFHVIIDAADAEWANQWQWSINKDGYASRSIQQDGKRHNILLHRELLGLPRKTDGRMGDHINRDRLDCRRSNLRIVFRGGNLQNVSSNRSATSQYRGVSWTTRKQRWAAQVQVSGKNVHLGYFISETDAAAAASAARRRLMPHAID